MTVHNVTHCQLCGEKLNSLEGFNTYDDWSDIHGSPVFKHYITCHRCNKAINTMQSNKQAEASRVAKENALKEELQKEGIINEIHK